VDGVLLMQDAKKAVTNSAHNCPHIQAGAYCFPKDRHLRHQSHFEYVYNFKLRFDNHIVRAYFSPAKGPQGAVAFIANKRVGNAVKRNYCRRVLREIYRYNQDRLNGVDIILSAKHSLLTHSFSASHAQMFSLFSRISQYKL
jgi:ribonuclease P protein component